jgi:tetratricopeptide (TPR) repeat protein
LPAPGRRSLEPAGRSGASRDLASGRPHPGALDADRRGAGSRAVPSGGTPDYGDWKEGRVYTHGDKYYDYTGRYTGYRPPYYGGGCYYPYYHYYPYCWSWGYWPSWWWGYYCGWWPGYNWCWWNSCFYFGFGFYWPYYHSYGRYWPAYYAYWYPYDYGYYYGYTSYLPERVVVYESYPSSVVVEGGAVEPPAKEDPMAAGDVLLRAGDYEGAAAEYRKVVDSEPENSIAKFALADALFALGRYHEAAYMARLGLTQDPGWLDAVVNKGDLFESLEEFDSLLENLRTRTGADAYDSAVWFLLGYQLYFAGRYDESEAALEHCLTVLPGDRIVTRMLEKIAEREKPVEAAPSEAEPKKSEVRATEISSDVPAAR